LRERPTPSYRDFNAIVRRLQSWTTDEAPVPQLNRWPALWLMAKAPPRCRRFDASMPPSTPIIRLELSPNDNGPSPCDEGPLEGPCPALPGVADGIRNGDLSC